MHNKFFIFATQCTPYVTMAYTCKISFLQFDVDVEVVTFPKRGTWMKSCLHRSVMLSEYAVKHPDFGIGLLDADLECLKDPLKLKSFDGDVAVRDLGMDDPQWLANKASRYSAGVLLFGKSAHGRACLTAWSKRCAEDDQLSEMLREQVYLYDSIEEIKAKGATVVNLGEPYNHAISAFTEPSRPVTPETVIVHHVASRKLREEMGGGM